MYKHTVREEIMMKKLICALLAFLLFVPTAAWAEGGPDAELIWRTADFGPLIHQGAESRWLLENLSQESQALCADVAAVDFSAPRRAYVCSTKSAIQQFAETILFGSTDFTSDVVWYYLATPVVLNAWSILEDQDAARDDVSEILRLSYSYAPISGVDRSYFVLLQYEDSFALTASYIYSYEDGSFMVEIAPLWLSDKQLETLEKNGLADLLRNSDIPVSASSTVWEGEALAAMLQKD